MPSRIPPFQYPGYDPRPSGGSSIAQLILARGQAEAEGANRTGEIWQNTAANVGQLLSGAIQQRGVQQEEKKKKAALALQDQTFMARISNPDAGPLKPEEALQIYGPERGPAIYKGYAALQSPQADLKTVMAGFDASSSEMRAQAWPMAVQHLQKAGVPPEMIPKEWDEGWYSRFKQAAAGQPKAEGLKEVSPGASLYDPNTKTSVFTAPTIPPKPEKGPTAGSFEDYMGADPARRAEIEKARKGYQQADDRPRVDVHLPGAAGGLNPDAVDYTATQYRILGPAGIPTRLGESDKVNIINAAAKQTKLLGQTPAQAVQKQAAYKADGASLTKMSTMKSAAESFENKAVGQADIVSGLSKKVARSQFPLLNQAILSGKANFGDTDTQLLYNSITTFSAEYAKIMEGSTGSAAGSSDAARKAADRLISAQMKDGTIQATLNLMKQEMRLTIGGYDATIGHITERMGGTQGGPPGPAVPIPPPAAGGAPQVGATKKFPNGKVGTWDGHGWFVP